MDDDLSLPKHIRYWMSAKTKHDCFFIVGAQSGLTERIGAIKILLIGQSDVLRNMLEESPLAETEDISILDSDPDSFKNFLKCVYGGTDIVVRNITYENCLKVLYLCEKYLTSEIKDKISSLILQLYQPLTVEHILKGLSSPAFLACDRLANAVSTLVQRKTCEVIEHEQFLNLDVTSVLFIVKQDRISTEEINLWKAVLKWAKKHASLDSENVKDLRSCLGNILKYIRFCTMEANNFCEFVVPSRVLTQEETCEICIFIGTKEIPKCDEICCNVFNRYKVPTYKQTCEITFTFVVNNIREFKGLMRSPSVKLGDCTWHTLFTRSSRGKIGVFLVNKGENIPCYAETEHTIVNQGGKRDISRSTKHVFTKKEIDWGVADFCAIDDLLDTKKGFIKTML